MGVNGMLTPAQRDGKGDFAHGTGTALYVSKVEQCLGTRRDELPWSNRGCRFYLLRHKSMPEELWAPTARAFAEEALRDEMPDVVVQDVQVTKQRDAAGLPTIERIRVYFDVIDTNTGNQKLTGLVADVRP